MFELLWALFVLSFVIAPWLLLFAAGVMAVCGVAHAGEFALAGVVWLVALWISGKLL